MCLRHKGAVSSPDPGLFLAHPPLTDRVPHLLAFLLSCSRYRVPHIPRSLLLVTIGDMPTFIGVHIGMECARAGRREIIDHLWKDVYVASRTIVAEYCNLSQVGPRGGCLGACGWLLASLTSA
jgi:hypothetical protein